MPVGLRTPLTVDILEVKRTLDGAVRTFPCRAAEVTGERAVLLYTLQRPGRVGDLPLPAGTLTVAYFWRDRPYNVYHWIAPGGETLGYYFNLSGPVRISRERVEWEDLEVDVLVTPDQRVRVLDEDRVPASAVGRLGEIARARARVLEEHARVVREVRAASADLLARAVPGTGEDGARPS
jgi:hypothetical protein